jgi:hypothetical protein
MGLGYEVNVYVEVIQLSALSGWDGKADAAGPRVLRPDVGSGPGVKHLAGYIYGNS